MSSKKPSITIRVNEEEYQILKEWADNEYRTVPSLVLALTKKAIDEQSKPKSQKESRNDSA